MPISSNIYGDIQTEDGKTIEKAEVYLSGGVKQFQISNGSYSFNNIKNETPVSLKVSKDLDHLNGINSLDLVYINNHILGKSVIISPYKLLAADVNNDKKISTADVIAIKKLILHVTEKFENKKSWFFLPKDKTFTNPQNPFNDIETDTWNLGKINKDLKLDFLGIKTGDVNGDVQPKFQNPVTHSRSDENIFLQAALNVPVIGKIVKIPFYYNGPVKLKAAQFTLSFNSNDLEFMEFEFSEQVADTSFYGLNYLKDGKITFCSDKLITPNTSPLFSIVFRAKTSRPTNEHLEINSAITESLGFDINEQAKNINLEFVNEKITKINVPFIVSDFKPNPFKVRTETSLFLPETKSVFIEVTDLYGVLLNASKEVFAEGENIFSINSQSLKGPGIYFCRFKTDKENVVKPLILLK